MDAIVADASLVGKWFLTDEDDLERALSLRDRFADGDLEAYAPPHVLLEVAAALLRAARRGRFPVDAVELALTALESFGLAVDDLHSLARRSAALGMQLGLHPFDAAYLVVASDRDVPLVTADTLLCEAGRSAGFDVILLRDLPA